MNENIPVIKVGKYAGHPVDTLPNGYLRWLIGQDFPADIVECAKKKLEASDHNDLFINVTRHAIDMFSKRFLGKWQEHIATTGDEADGLGTFVAKYAQEAWENGEDVSKHRHQDDGIQRLYGDITFVFTVSPTFPDYRELITVM